VRSEEYIEAIEEMPIEVTKSNFEALMALALAIEAEEAEAEEE
jgi:hypothetical protein